MNKVARAPGLTLFEKLVAVAWLPLSQLTGLSNRFQYLALLLIIAAISVRIIWMPLGAYRRPRRPSLPTGFGSWLLLTWSAFVIVHLALYFRALGYFWDLKLLALAIMWIALLPAYVYLTLRDLAPDQARTFVRLGLAGLVTIVAMNVVGQVAGVATNVALYGGFNEESRLLGMVGISQRRIAFPFSNGINNFGILVGVVLLGAVTYLRVKGFASRALCAAVVLLCLGTFLFLDSRAVLIWVALILLLSFFFRGFHRSWLVHGFMLLGIAGPIVLVLVAQVLPYEWLNAFGRGRGGANAAEVLTTGRAFIWASVMRDLVAHPVALFFGYGPYSQGVSDAGVQLARFFSVVGASAQFTFHSSLMQYLMDGGLLAVTSVVAFLLTVAGAGIRLAKSEAPAAAAGSDVDLRFLIGAFALIVACGATEAAYTMYLRDSQLLLIYLASILTSLYFIRRPEAALVPRRPAAAAAMLRPWRA